MMKIEGLTVLPIETLETKRIFLTVESILKLVGYDWIDLYVHFDRLNVLNISKEPPILNRCIE